MDPHSSTAWTARARARAEASGITNPWRALVQQSFQAFEADALFRAHADYSFEKLEELGSGGTGLVARVYDHRSRREAALKILGDASDPRLRERFIREARVTALLDHPAIPPVYEYGRNGRGEFYMLMKLIRGEDLSERLARFHRQGRPARGLASLLRVLARVCEALDYAHTQGVIHRDLKPANIMIGAHGEVFVVDWGVARYDSESETEDLQFRAAHAISESVFESNLSVAGGVVGTYGYMAPEQARGQPVSASSDLYALGAMLFELMTGRTIVGHGGMASVIRAMEGTIDYPPDFGEGFPPEIADLCRRCLEHDPGRRPLSAKDILPTLRAAQGISSKPRPKTRRPSRTPLLIALPTALFLGLALGLALAPRTSDQLIAERNASRRAAQAAEKKLEDLDARLNAALETARLKDREAAAARAALEEARALQTRSSAERSKEVVAWREAARTRLQGRDYQGAIRDLGEALKIDPNDRGSLILRASAYYRLGEDEKSLADLKRAQSLGSKSPQICFNSGLSLLRLKKFDEAVAAFKESLSLDPTYAPTHQQLSKVLILQGKKDEALDHLNQALALKDEPTGRNKRAWLRCQRKEYALALEDFQRALELSPDSIESLRGSGLARFYLGEFRASIADFDRVVAKVPADARSLLFLARCYRGLGDAELAKAKAAKARSLVKAGTPLQSEVEDFLAELAKESP